MTWTARGKLHDGTPYVVAWPAVRWPSGLPVELRGLVEDAELEQAAFLYSPTGPTLFPGAVDGAWLLALLRDRTHLGKVTGRPPHWPLPPGACG